MQFSHAGASKLIFSNSPSFYDKFALKDNDETITGTWLVPSPTSATQIANKTYCDALAIAGVATSTESQFGGVWLSTQLQMASSTDGSPNAPYVLQSKYATSTPDGTSQSGLYTPISQNNGKLHQLWLDLTEAFTWTGAHIFTGGFSSYTDTIGLYFTATSTTQASTFPYASTTALTISGTGSTTDMYISGNQYGGAMTYTASSTAFSVSTGTVTYTGSIPTNANQGIGTYSISDTDAVANAQGNVMIFRTGLTSSVISVFDGSGGAAETDGVYTFNWSGANLEITETTDSETDSALTGTIYWYQ